MKYSVTLKISLAEIAEVAYTSFAMRVSGGSVLTPWKDLSEYSKDRWLYVAQSVLDKMGIEQSIIDAETP